MLFHAGCVKNVFEVISRFLTLPDGDLSCFKFFGKIIPSRKG
jgi:hypothetical protein